MVVQTTLFVNLFVLCSDAKQIPVCLCYVAIIILLIMRLSVDIRNLWVI